MYDSGINNDVIKNFPVPKEWETFKDNSTSDQYSQFEPITNKNSFENKKFDANIVLNDRDLFNKFSNINDEIDVTSIKHGETNYGMPVVNNNIMNNKKNLITKPFIPDKSINNNFKSNSISQDMYAELESDIQNNENLIHDSNNSETNYNCNIEKDIAEFEFEYNKNKDKNFIVDVNSPFALGYIWKSLLLLSKNPSSEKILKALNIKNKDLIVNDMKNHSEIFSDIGEIIFIIPNTNQVLNTNFISKINEIYKIKIMQTDNLHQQNIIVNVNYKFELKIPFYYQPKIVNDYLLKYTKNKIKFIELINVPTAIIVDSQNDIILFEIPFAENMILGFLYNTKRTNVDNLPYDLLLVDKVPNSIIKKLVIPKINRNKKSDYSKKFKNELEQIHLGEIIYGKLFDVDINLNISLNLTVDTEVPNKKYEIKQTIPEMLINHACYYYIKNEKIPNKILCTGMINY